MSGFTFRVVSSNGAGVYGREFKTLLRARRSAIDIASAHPDWGPFEIERIETTVAGRRYWLKNGSRWQSWRGDMPGPEERHAWCCGGKP